MARNRVGSGLEPQLSQSLAAAIRASHPQVETYDVLAVNIKTGIVRFMAQGKDERNAEAVVKMAVMRRGVDEEFYVAVKAGAYKESDKYGEGKTNDF